jgi:polysaccharide export outer membrane protein
VKSSVIAALLVVLTTTVALEAQPRQDPPRVEPTPETESFYRIQVSDVLDIKYRYTPEYNVSVQVRPDGFVSLPIVGDIKLLGLTVADAHREIVRRAEVRLREPELTVELKDFQKPRFVVGGQVDKPGQFELRGRTTVLEAISMAGGLKTSAKHSQVILFRRYDEERAVTRLVNVKDLTRTKGAAEDPELRAGDFIFVPQNRISKMERLVPFATMAWMLGTFVP